VEARASVRPVKCPRLLPLALVLMTVATGKGFGIALWLAMDVHRDASQLYSLRCATICRKAVTQSVTAGIVHRLTRRSGHPRRSIAIATKSLAENRGEVRQFRERPTGVSFYCSRNPSFRNSSCGLVMYLANSLTTYYRHPVTPYHLECRMATARS